MQHYHTVQVLRLSGAKINIVIVWRRISARCKQQKCNIEIALHGREIARRWCNKMMAKFSGKCSHLFAAAINEVKGIRTRKHSRIL